MTPTERESYQDIKIGVLLAYYGFCRDRGHCLGRPHEQILAAVEYEFESVYQSAVENAMLKVALLVLSAGMHTAQEAGLRKQIEGEVRTTGLANLLTDVPKEEAEEFKRDLRVFGLI